MYVSAYGAMCASSPASTPKPGGRGGSITARYFVTPGETLLICVGGAGGQPTVGRFDGGQGVTYSGGGGASSNVLSKECMLFPFRFHVFLRFTFLLSFFWQKVYAISSFIRFPVLDFLRQKLLLY